MENCVFCKIANKEIPCNKIYEDKEFLAFLDVRPLNKGHTLIISKKHFRWIWDVNNFGKYFEVVKKVEKGIKKAMKTEWVVLGAAGNEVPHAHVHLVPRFENDGHGGFIRPENVKNISKEELKKIADEIGKNI